jgi:BASS family bile acid:Na+ symporter
MTPDIDAARLAFSPAAMNLLNGVLAIVIFAIALDLRPAQFGALARAPRPLLTGLFAQFALLPAMTFLVVVALAPPPSIALGLILVAACPGGNISNFITHRAGGNVALSVALTAIATGGAVLLTPVNIAFWGGMHPPTRALMTAISLDPVSIALTIALMLGTPLVLGMVVNRWAPDASRRIRGPLQGLSMLIFIAFVSIAFIANFDLFVTYGPQIVGLVAAHNALALAAGYGAARAAGLSAADTRSVTFETGIQNSGLGLILIFGFFGGLGGMALVAAFWGIWHAVTGLLLARIWSKTVIQP